MKPLILALEAIIVALQSIIAWLWTKDEPQPEPKPTPEPEPTPEPAPEPEPTPPSTGGGTPSKRKLLFAYALPISSIGPVFNAAMQVVTKNLPAQCDEAAASGGLLIGSQGGYDRFLREDTKTGLLAWQLPPMLEWIRSHAPYAAAIKLRQDRGSLLGVQDMDDHASAESWPPSGVSVADQSAIHAEWKRVVPGIVVLQRARPRQYTEASYPTGVDIWIAQWRYWGFGDETPEEFAQRELAMAAKIGGQILWSINLENGGSNVKGDKGPMTPAQVERALMAFAAVPGVGVGVWKWTPRVEQPEYQAVFRRVRARLDAE